MTATIEDIETRKLDLRKKMLVARAYYPDDMKEKYALLAGSALHNLIIKRNVKVLHTYLPMGDEIDHKDVIQLCLNEGIKVVSPRVEEGRTMKHLVLESLDNLEKGPFSTLHPATNEVYEGSYDMVVVPGLAFSSKGDRIGYGAGYYDQFLKDHPDAFKAAICYPFQLEDEIPMDAHDIKVDAVLHG